MTNDNDLKVLMVEIDASALIFSSPAINEIPPGAVLCWEINGIEKAELLEYASTIGELGPELLICVGDNSSFFAQIIEEEIFFQEQDEFQDDIIDPNIEVFGSPEPAIYFGLRYLDRNAGQIGDKLFFLTLSSFDSTEEKITSVFKNLLNK